MVGHKFGEFASTQKPSSSGNFVEECVSPLLMVGIIPA
jgi:ribosomal protein S19